ncbi:MAG: hypothetical protein ACI865_000009 [Flavobacteriaceae bacterium]|jgi:hypothetical protein
MKLIFLLLLLPFTSTSQTYKDNQAQSLLTRVKYTSTDLGYVLREHDHSLYKKLGIMGITINQGRNERRMKVDRLRLNQTGNLIKKSGLKDTTTYTYVNDSLVQSILTHGSEKSATHYDYHAGKLIKKEHFEGNSLASRIVVQYDHNENIVFSMVQSGRKLKNSYAMKYTYGEEKVERQVFMKNEVILKRWNYSCEPKGELEEEKNRSSICKYVEENRDGSYVLYIRTIEKGKPLLYSHSFTADSVNYASNCTNEQKVIIWTAKYEDNLRDLTWYTEKGKFERNSVYRYTPEKQLLTLTTKRGKKKKMVSKLINEYNPNGTLANSESFYKGKLTYTRTYTYVKD